MSMRATRVLRATSNTGVIPDFPSRPRLPRAPKNPLLKPLDLYRLILRTHRSLPPELRTIGDPYVKSEFKLHKGSDNPMHIVGFLSEWQKYVQDLKGSGWRGLRIDKEKIDKMSDEQVGQLYELMQATTEQIEAKEVADTENLIDKITKKA